MSESIMTIEQQKLVDDYVMAMKVKDFQKAKDIADKIIREFPDRREVYQLRRLAKLGQSNLVETMESLTYDALALSAEFQNILKKKA